MAFVVIQHLEPTQPSLLTPLLAEVSPLPVVEAANGMRVEPNRIHVIPPDADLGIHAGVLALLPRHKTGRLHLPIDGFLQALALDAGERAIGVILSGSGVDGTAGLRSIKAEGGIVMAEDPESAFARGMPASAVSLGLVDFLATPERIADELVRLSKHPYVASLHADVDPLVPDQETGLAALFTLLRQRVGIDFGSYKRTTVLRRIDRRMAIRRVSSLADYLDVLRAEPNESTALARDMLIHVTAFFRDFEAFRALEERVLRDLVEHKRAEPGSSIRVWVPGCATGEEAYSVAIAILEAVGKSGEPPTIKLFGSDLSSEAIETARLGVYPDAIAEGVGPERLARFFERVDGGYRITKRVRDVCIFVKHDLTRDAPFAKLDLVSCRNVLIYFDADLQRRVVPMLHYCLNKGGHLFLGQSETVTGFRDLFTPIDMQSRLFAKTGTSARLAFPIPGASDGPAKLAEQVPSDRAHPAREAQRQADHFLLSRYAPPGVVVNERLEVLQFRGRTGDYLEAPPGQPQANVLRMARGGLAAHLHDAIERAQAQGITVRKEGLRIDPTQASRLFHLEVVPLSSVPDPHDRYFLIVFEPADAGSDRPSVRPLAPSAAPEDAVVGADRLRTELIATKDYLQSLVAEHQTTSEELVAANEALVAANEELQSTNEELQSAKEELQSTNEELSTLNDQLRTRNQELDQVASDLVNILSSVDIPVIIVDLDLRVRRFTPSARNIANLIPEDVGRSIEDLKLKVQVDDLSARMREVMRTLAPMQWEVLGQDGRWLRMDIRPYRAGENRLDGAVLSFIDVDDLKRAVQDVESARDYARSIVDTVSSALLVLDDGLRIQSANNAFVERFGAVASDVEGKRLGELGVGPWNDPTVQTALAAAVASPSTLALRSRFTPLSSFALLEVTLDLPHSGKRTYALSGRPIVRREGPPMALLAIDDVTELRALEAERRSLLESEQRARQLADEANGAKDLFLATLSHELRTPLSTMLMSAQVLERVARDDARMLRATASIARAVKAQTRLIDDLLDVSRIVAGKLLLDLGPVDFGAVVDDVVDSMRPSAAAKSIDLEIAIEARMAVVFGDSARLQQVIQNLIVNAIKFTPHGGRVGVGVTSSFSRIVLSVSDTGIGVSPEILPKLFARFMQADSSVTRSHGGLGLGLSIVRHVVELHSGSVSAESEGPGMGATFRVSLPLGSVDSGAAHGASSASFEDVRGVRVLLVEDEDDTREAYSVLLRELGAEVCAVTSAKDALEALIALRPDVILSDVSMPGEDGFSFIEKVRRREVEVGGYVPAAALTALASDEDRKRAISAGFQLHVPKPVDSARLASVVSRLAAMRRPGN